MKFLTIMAMTAVASVFASSSLHAMNTVKPYGKHENVNLVGHPNLKECAGEDSCSTILGGNAGSSGGRALFVPLVTAKRPKNFDLETMTCTSNGTQTTFEDEQVPTYTTAEPDGKTRIYFETTTDPNGFEIIDRIADGNGGRIRIPISEGDGQYVTLHLWVRVLGKKGGCAEISGYAEETTTLGTESTDLWWYSGSILLSRKAKKSAFIYATDIFNVKHCTLEEVLDGETVIGYQCADGSEEELSVFDDIFNGYFWEFNNYRTRLIQLRFYYGSTAE